MDEQGKAASSVTVFYSYAHEDESLRDLLEKHLSILRRQGIISDWHDRKIVPGTEWAEEIDAHLEAASLILLLISPDFLASDYCYSVEMRRALQRYKNGEAQVVPIILRPVDWEGAPFAHLLCLPRDAKAVTEWDNRDAAFRDIARGIRTAIQEPPSPSIQPQTIQATSRAPATANTQGSTAPTDRNRQRMLKRVYATWITGVLEQSLHGAALILLGLEEKANVLDNPWRIIMQEVDRPAQPLPAGTRIIDIYNAKEGGLLILGEPGAGKTTLLLDLARDLLDCAQTNENAPIPVVFNLSSWAKQRPALSDWLVEELSIRYEVAHRLGRSWVSEDQLHLLLDGLDEVASAARKECIEAINSYRQTHPEVQVVVCCRSTEYLNEPTQLRLHTAVVIQPLTQEQIETYLESAGEQAKVLREALRQDADLRELATTPLMLTILLFAYSGTSPDKISELTSLEAKREQIFASYVQHMLKRRGASKRYRSEQIMHWLTYLAWQMTRQNQTELYLERMQPDWLPNARTRIVYRVVVVLVAWLVCVLTGVLVGVLVGGLLTGLLAGLALGLLSGLVGGLVLSLKKEIKPTEVIAWSWQGVQKGSLLGLSFGLLLGLVSGLFGGLFGGLSFGLLFGPLAGLDFGLAGGLAGVLVVGLSGQKMDQRSLVTPNQGIWRSARNSVLFGLGSGLIAGLVGVLIAGQSAGLIAGQDFGLILALLVGLVFGLISGLFGGGDAFIQHFVLRWFLWSAGFLPWKYSHFLDYAVERILLKKVGGGYIFLHRLLLDYFASVKTPSPEEASVISVLSDPQGASASTHLTDTAYREENSSFPALSRKVDLNKENGVATLFVVILLLALLASSAGIFSVVQHSVQPAYEATATAQVKAQSITQAKAYEATATAQAEFEAIGQVEFNATTEALANASPVAYLPPNKSPVLDDPIQDNSRGNYWQVDTLGNGDCKFINQAYDIDDRFSDFLDLCVAQTTDFTNFIYEVQMKIVKGDGGGIAFRIDTTNNYSNRYYYFAINQDGSYSVLDDGYAHVLAQGFSSAIHKGLNQINLVAAVVHGNIIELYVNHQRIAVVGSNTYTHGRIGVIVNPMSNETEVIFQNAKVWTL